MVRRLPALAALVGLALLLVTSVVAPVAGAPPPRPLCDACSETFEETADEHGVDVVVTGSTATVRVTENGTAVWTVRNELQQSGGAERLRANETLRTEIADRAMWDTELLGSNVSIDGTLTMRYRESDFAAPAVGGTLRSGAFTESYGYRNLDGLGADRLTLVAPDGMAVDRAVPGANVSADRSRMTLTELDTGFVTFVQRGDPVGPLWSVLALATLLGPVVVLNAVVGIGVPTAVFGVFVGALSGVLSWLDPDLDRLVERPDVVLGGLGTAAVAGALAGTTLSSLGTANAPVLGAGVGVAAIGAVLSVQSVRDRLSYRVVVALAGLGIAVSAGATVVARPLFQSTGLLRSQAVALAFVVPLFAFLPAGYALATGRRGIAVGTAAVAFAIAAVQQVPLLSPGIAGVLVGLIAALSAVIVVACGVPLALTGYALEKTGS